MGEVTRPQASPAALHGRSLEIEDGLIPLVGKKVQLQRLLQAKRLLLLVQLEGNPRRCIDLCRPCVVPEAWKPLRAEASHDLKAHTHRVLSARLNCRVKNRRVGRILLKSRC